jgi:hypothetical protein
MASLGNKTEWGQSGDQFKNISMLEKAVSEDSELPISRREQERNQQARIETQSAGENRNAATITIAFFFVDSRLNEM